MNRVSEYGHLVPFVYGRESASSMMIQVLLRSIRINRSPSVKSTKRIALFIDIIQEIVVQILTRKAPHHVTILR